MAGTSKHGERPTTPEGTCALGRPDIFLGPPVQIPRNRLFKCTDVMKQILPPFWTSANECRANNRPFRVCALDTYNFRFSHQSMSLLLLAEAHGRRIAIC